MSEFGKSTFFPEALRGPNTPLQEACRACPTFLRATSTECSREVALEVLPVHSQHLAAGLVPSCGVKEVSRRWGDGR